MTFFTLVFWILLEGIPASTTANARSHWLRMAGRIENMQASGLGGLEQPEVNEQKPAPTTTAE
jgi:hypothetical protein